MVMTVSKPLTDALIRIASAEIGVRETSNNSGARIRLYQSATWLEPGMWPWCAAFVAWCLREWVAMPEVRKALNLLGGTDAWRCKDARAYGWEEWAKKRGLQLFGDKITPRPGDIVTYDFSHIGIVKEPLSDGQMSVIEGNTNDEGSREGDGVYLRKRPVSLARQFIRILS